MGKLYQTPLLPVEKDQVTSNYSIGRPNSFPHAARNHAFDPKKRQLQMPLQIPAPPIALPLSSTNQGIVSGTNHNPTYCCFFCLMISPLWKAMKAWAANKYAFLDKRMTSVPYSPISLSDLLSISVSVSVSAELERLERHEFCPDFAPVPQRVMVRSGDTGSWFSVATGPLE